MQILKPSWVSHDGGGIYSLDIDPSGTKLATGGTDGDGGGVFAIWSLGPILCKQQENDANVPKMLCRVEDLSCVNVVRWSMDGRYLATGGDDTVVKVWHYVGRSLSTGSIGSSKPNNIEVWKHAYLLRGHTADILHLEWSPDDKMLASCGVDKQVIVWDVRRLPDRVTTLADHTDFVKGVAWDPAGRYLASQSCDKTVRIYAVSTWQCVKTIKEPFAESGSTTLVLRLSWATEGSTLVAAHATNAGGPTAQIITRSDWTADKDMVGHRKGVSCVRFSPVLYQRNTNKKKKAHTGCCVALGSRDRGISVWQDQFVRPVVVLTDLFTQGVVDLTWSPDGLNIMACSVDGTVACLTFEDGELGCPLTKLETEDHMQLKYGKRFNKGPMHMNASSDFVANPLAMQAQSQLHNKAQNNVDKENVPVGRVEPPIIAPQVTPPQLTTHQSVVVTPGGKKRIKPIFLGSCTDTIAAPISLVSETRPEPVVPPTTKPAPVLQRKHKKKRSSARAKSPLIVKRTGVISEDDERRIGGCDSPTTHNIPLALNTRLLINTPPITNSISLSIHKVGNEDGEFTCIVENYTKVVSGQLTVVTVTVNRGDTRLWQTPLSHPVSCMNASSELIACACKDGSVHVLCSRSGQIVAPAFVLDSAPVLLCVHTHYVAVVTAKAKVYEWNINTKRSLITREPLDFLVSHAETVKVSGLDVCDNGSVIVQLSDGSSYAYSALWKTWCLVEDGSDVVTRMSSLRGKRNNIAGPVQCPVGMQLACSQVVLERRIEMCVQLGDPQEYSLLMHEYVKLLTEAADWTKLKRTFDNLSSAIVGVPGVHCAQLLSEVVLIAAVNPALAWLCTQYSQQQNMNCI